MANNKYKFKKGDRVQVQYPKGALKGPYRLKNNTITTIHSKRYSAYFKCNTYELENDYDGFYLEYELKLHPTGIEKAVTRIKGKNEIPKTKRK